MTRWTAHSSATLAITFVLGLLIGFSACLALLASRQEPDAAGRSMTQRLIARVWGDRTPSAVSSAGRPPGEVRGVPGRSTPAPAVQEPAPGAKNPEDALSPLQQIEDIWPGRHLFVTVRGATLTAREKTFLEEVKPGGVVLLGDNCQSKDQIQALVAEIKQALRLGGDISDLPIVAVDQEGGPVNRLKLEEAPSAADLGAAADPARARAIGASYGRTCRELGIGAIFAPVLDVYEPGAAAGMEARSFGEDHLLVAAMGLAFAEGVMSEGVLAIAKHYPGLGSVTENTHEKLAVLKKDQDGIALSVYPFWMAVGLRIPGLMAGHVAVPALDNTDPPRPASLSPILIRQNLRQQWHYEGVIITDDIAMGAVAGGADIAAATIQALAAGCDAVVVVEFDVDRLRDLCTAVEKAVEDGTLSRADLTHSKERLDAWQQWLHTPKPLDGPLPPVPPRVKGKRPATADKKPEPEAPVAPTVAATASEESVPLPGIQPPGTKVLTYTIAKGDSLLRIARKFNVTGNEIVAWNGLKDANDIKWGFDLVVYVPMDFPVPEGARTGP